MPVPRSKRFNRKLALAFGAVLLGTLAVAQDGTSYLTPDVMRVGGKLACRCGGCRNTVGDCPMLRCSSADPLRHRIFDRKQAGDSDSQVVNEIVREQGIVALATPPAEGLGPIITWLMPGVVLLLGLAVYYWFVKRHRKQPAPLTAADETLIDRYRSQMDRELGDDRA